MTANSRADEAILTEELGYEHTLRVFLLAVFASALAVSAFTLFLRWPLIPQIALAVAASTSVALVLSRSGRPKAGHVPWFAEHHLCGHARGHVD
jgi:hypothetical protein